MLLSRAGVKGQPRVDAGDDVERTSLVQLHTVHTHDDRYNLFQWPAAAVIPAPIAYIKVAAVKKLVVGFLTRPAWPAVVTRVSAGCCPSVFLLLVCPLH